MRAGQLDRQIIIWRKAIVGDPEYIVPDPNYGTEKPVWVPLAGYQPGSPQVPVHLPAEVQDVMPSRSEAVRQGLNMAKNQTRIRMRWMTGINSSMHITVLDDGAGQVFEIVGGPAEIEGRKQRLEMMCERYSS